MTLSVCVCAISFWKDWSPDQVSSFILQGWVDQVKAGLAVEKSRCVFSLPEVVGCGENVDFQDCGLDPSASSS